jgi:predicted NAD/FAD-binding protein
VIAWPEKYYHNYLRLLSELGLETTSMPISYFVKHPQGIFCQDGRTDLHRRRAADFRRWDRLIRVTGRINDFFLPKDPHESLYHFSYWNPLNLVPLYALTRLFGISARFWDEIFVPIHCASLVTTSMKDIPAVIAPLLESVVALERPCQAPSILAALEQPSWLQRTLLGRVCCVDDDDPTFSRFVVHSDTSIFPESHREHILSDYNTYTEVDEEGQMECTFVVSAQNPALKDLGRPMLVTFNSKKAIGRIETQIELPNPTHTLSLGNLSNMLMLRLLQGRGGLHYCGSFTTPEGGHDLSFLSGLVAARSIGAAYPFAWDDSPAVADYHQMQRIMWGKVQPNAPRGT